MFIYSVRAGTIKFAAVVCAAVVTLAALIIFVPEYTPRTTAAIAAKTVNYTFDKISTNEDRVAFLKQFGWETDGNVIEEVTMRIPSEFDRVMNTYNELQKKMGLDLSKYKGKEVTRYTYVVTNYPGYEGTVNANVIVYKKRVVGGDVSSSDVRGFIGTFEFPSEKSDIYTETEPSSAEAEGTGAEA